MRIKSICIKLLMQWLACRESFNVWSLFFLIFSRHIFMSINSAKRSYPRVGTWSLLFPTSLPGTWLINSRKVINIYWIINCRKSVWSHMVNRSFYHFAPCYRVYWDTGHPTTTCNSGCSLFGCLALPLAWHLSSLLTVRLFPSMLDGAMQNA